MELNCDRISNAMLIRLILWADEHHSYHVAAAASQKSAAELILKSPAVAKASA